MKTIKTKTISKTPRTMENAARVPKALVRQAAHSAKEHSYETANSKGRGENPDQYAVDKMERTGEEAARKTADGVKDVKNCIKNKQRERKDTRKSTTQSRASTKKSSSKNGSARNRQTALQSAKKNASPGKTVTNPGKPGVKRVRNHTKTLKHTVKTGGKTVKASARTIKTTAKATKVAAQAAGRAMRMARAAAKVAAAAVKNIIRILKLMVKAIIMAVKALISALAAGGWMVALIIVIAALIIFVISSVFGVFFADQAANDAPLKTIIAEINAEYQEEMDRQIEAQQSGGGFDKVKIIYTGNMDGDSDTVNNWLDILAVYAAMTVSEGGETITVPDGTKDTLKDIFNEMNPLEVTSEIQTEEVPTEPPVPSGSPGKGDKGKPKTEEIRTMVIFVDIQSLTAEEYANKHSFNAEQMEILNEILLPEYYSLYAETLGIDLYGGMTPGDLRGIISNLPPGQKGTAIVETALTRLGHPYSQPKRGEGNYVDCSYFVWWAYQQVGVSLPSTSVEQAQYCVENGYAVGLSELQPGDLIFWSKATCGCGRWNEIHHVGIYIGNNRVIEASSSKGRVVISELWGLGGGRWQVYCFVRPYA